LTTYEAHYAETKLRIWGRKLRSRLTIAVFTVGHEFRKTSPIARAHIVEHGYSIIGLGLFDSAMFVHSVFTGLLVTGISFLAFEWKVAAE